MTTVTEIIQATVGRWVRSKRPPMWPISKVAGAAIVIAGVSFGGTGCTASSDDVDPEPDQLFFPTGAAVSPDGARLFVANANSDLKFNSGSISVVPLLAAAGPDLASVEDVVAPWLATRAVPGRECDADDDDDDAADHPCCRRDEDFTETLVCDEDLFLPKNPQTSSDPSPVGAKIGNFATDLALQDLGDGRLRLVVPTRGDPSISWADWVPVPGRLSCTEREASFELCDELHRLSFVLNDDTAGSIPEEPFGVFADSAGQFAMVTHLTTGSVTLIDSPRDGLAQVTDIAREVFMADPSNGIRGATSVAGRTPHAPGDIVYVGSRSEDRVQTFTVGRPVNGAPAFLVMGSWFFLDGVGNGSNTNSNASDTRGMAFSPSGDRLYLLNRKPPSLQILDTSLAPTGVPRNELVGAVDVCRQASTVSVIDPGDGERAYLTCFQDGQIYVIDPRGRGRVEDVITVGRGPYSVAATPDGKRLFVTNFLEDTIAVIDLVPGSPTRNRVVLRIGEPRTP
jgi:DNA-binding beta-propeller fold protein YncE